MSRKAEVEKILKLSKEMKALSDEELKKKTELFRTKKAKEVKLEAFAVVREAAKRVLGMEAFPVQLQGALALYDGKVVEMKTGEGKTLVSIFPAYVQALTGKGVHIITVNEYLTQRDADWMGKVFTFLGLSVGISLHDMSSEEKGKAYRQDITYVTNTEIGFDFLNGFLETEILRGLHYCIIDEVDSILIDEARTPIIISQSMEEEDKIFLSSKALADLLVRGTGETDLSKIDAMSGILPVEHGDYLVNEKDKAILLTAQGVKKIEEYYGIENYSDSENVKYHHHIMMSLKAKELMHKDKDYIVSKGEVQIVDEFTGRIMTGRRFSDGLHEALEAKEGLPVQGKTKTAARITYQSLFNLYETKSGMSGTVYTDRKEFREIYGLHTERIPTNRPVIRKDHPDQVYATKAAKKEAILSEIKKIHKEHRPILIGTTNIRVSEQISEMLKKEGLSHEVLNAKNHYKEAQIIANAGQKDAITVATNMAGRGTDILLGEGVAELGGLMVLGTEKHEARRIDDQLRGRAGRQGDPGESMFFVSLEDTFIRQYGSDVFAKILKHETGELNSSSMRKRVLAAQKKIEQNHYGIRKSLYDYDKVDNRQFKAIIRSKESIENQFSVKGIYLRTIEQMCRTYDYATLKQFLPLDLYHVQKEDSKEEMARKLKESIKKADENIAQTLKTIYSYSIVAIWAEHIQMMEDLKKASRYQGIGKNPLDYYKITGYKYWKQSMNRINETAVILYLQH